MIGLAGLAAVLCLFQITRPGWGFLVAGLVVLGVAWAGGLGVWPALLQRFQVTPNELVAERPYIEHNIRMTRQAYGLTAVKEQEFAAEEKLTAAALERNSPPPSRTSGCGTTGRSSRASPSSRRSAPTTSSPTSTWTATPSTASCGRSCSRRGSSPTSIYRAGCGSTST